MVKDDAKVIKRVVRILITVLGAGVGYLLGSVIFMLAISTYSSADEAVSMRLAEILVPIGFAVVAGVVCLILSRRLVKNWGAVNQQLERNIGRLPVAQTIGGVLGMTLGLIIAYLISGLFSDIKVLHLGLVLAMVVYIILGIVGAIFGYRLGKQIAENRGGEEGGTIRFGVHREKSRQEKKHVRALPKIFDTSVLIDGRILELMKTGFIEGDIIIPEYVLTELRHLSDSADPLKKAKGRRGLALLKELQSYYGIDIYNTYSDSDWEGVEEVDVKLLRTAQKLGGKVVTNDYNLIQVAEIQEIPVLNINDVVNALRAVVIPGEEMKVSVIREGRESNQGVGYMEDGTMIVVEGGKRLIGRDVLTEVTSILQTASGRMIFAKPKRNIS